MDDEMVLAAEAELGYVLPRSYVELIRQTNGGLFKRRCCPVTFPTSWAPDHFEIRSLVGIGGERGIDTRFGSKYMIEEWEYPNVGIVICDLPSGGHDMVMLDYRECGPGGEPAVVYVDEDRVPRRVADTFAEFLGILRDCGSFQIVDWITSSVDRGVLHVLFDEPEPPALLWISRLAGIAWEWSASDNFRTA
ncbi:SMI1/KNR4 family protein [Actinokineospora globicatena]|uniref:SMI1/KNR4 family protein n=1 Tax=Actinokineospora globicatena TaxID=103729 RepID=UPI0020A3DDFD|nr:SMI1/KNR4 family protein [Actinokineospora globicatena]